MIRKFQKYSSSLLAKILLGLFAISFAMWGIGDMFKNFGSANYIAKIGAHTISIPEFQQQMNLLLANYRQLLGAEYSPEIVKRLGLPQQILGEMVNGLLLQNEAESLGVALSDAEMMKLVSSNEAFRGRDGFDKNMFQSALKSSGMTENDYLKALRTETSSNLLLAHLDGSPLVQRPMLEALYRLRGENREATAYIFTPTSLGAPSTPSHADLAAYYDKNKEQFKTADLRKLSFVTVDPKTLKKTITVKDSTLHKLYESRKESYQTPEKRKIRQLLYTKKEQAENALALLKQENTIEEVAKKNAPSNQELSLGNITANELMTEAREAVFALQKGGYSNVIETSFGWHIFVVDDITAGIIPDFTKIEPQLREEVLESKLEDELYKLSTDLEDQLAGGAELATVAKEMNLPLTTTAFFDAQGNMQSADGAALPPVKDILRRAFSGDLENTPEFQAGEDGKHYFLTVAAAIPAAIPTLKDAHAQVLAAWQTENTAKKISEKVTQISEMLKKGQSDILKGLMFNTQKTGKFSRNDMGDESNINAILPSALKHELFTLKVGDVSGAYPLDNGNWVIAKLDAIHLLADKTITDKDLDGLRNEMSEQYSDELMQLYLANLRRKFPIEVNQAALNSVLK